MSYFLGMVALLYVYRTLSIFVIKRKSKQPVKIIPGTEPFFLRRSSDKVALLIHGFTSSPSEMRGIGDFLAEKNISAYAPLLPGHGTTPERLSLIKFEQWVEHIREQIKMLEKDYGQIYLIGNSFGGNIAIMSAGTSLKLKGLITIASPIFFHKERMRKYLFFVLKNIKLFQKKKYESKEYEILVKKVGKSYDSIPLTSLSQVLKAINLSKIKLKEILIPILVIQAKQDHVVSSQSAHFILDNVKSERKELLIIEDGNHVMVLNAEEQKIKNGIYNFISEADSK